MDMKIAQRIMQLEKEAVKIQDEINAINYRVANTQDVALIKNATKELKLLDKDLKQNNKELKKALKELKKINKE